MSSFLAPKPAQKIARSCRRFTPLVSSPTPGAKKATNRAKKSRIVAKRHVQHWSQNSDIQKFLGNPWATKFYYQREQCRKKRDVMREWSRFEEACGGGKQDQTRQASLNCGRDLERVVVLLELDAIPLKESLATEEHRNIGLDEDDGRIERSGLVLESE